MFVNEANGVNRSPELKSSSPPSSFPLGPALVPGEAQEQPPAQCMSGSEWEGAEAIGGRKQEQPVPGRNGVRTFPPGHPRRPCRAGLTGMGREHLEEHANLAEGEIRPPSSHAFQPAAFSEGKWTLAVLPSSQPGCGEANRHQYQLEEGRSLGAPGG